MSHRNIHQLPDDVINSRREDCPAFKKSGAHKRTIAVDLDGTIFVGSGCGKIGPPITREVERLRRLKELGYYIIIYTARINDEVEAFWGPQEDYIKEELYLAGVSFDEIWTGRGKPVACWMADNISYPTIAALYYKLSGNYT